MTRDDVRTGFADWAFPSPDAIGFPNIVNVEVFRGACPCRCVHCPVGTTEPERREERFGVRGIAPELYDKITREVAEHSWATVRMHSVGDPILWSDLPAALEVGRRNGVRTWIFTSAVTADRALLAALCDGADVVEVSINSIDRGDFHRTKGIDAFDLVCENLRQLSELRRRSVRTRLIASRTQSGDDAADQAFVRHWQASGLVDDAFVRSYHTYNGLLPDRTDAPCAAHEPCLVHWARFNINVEGLAVVCFNELFRESLAPEVILGDIRRETIAEVWHGAKLTALRQAELSGDYSGLAWGGSLPCRTCTCCQPLSGRRPTSEQQIRQLPIVPPCPDC